MKNIFAPKEKLDRFTDLDIDRLYEEGYRLALLDVDNTIAIPNTGSCDERAEKFINDLEEKGFKVVIFSNNHQKRVKMFIRDIDVNYRHLALKPLPFAYWEVCRKHNVKPEQTLVLGDQLVTDILGANLSGCYGIYCKQLQEKDTKMTAFNRRIEKFIWRHFLHEKV